MSKDYYKTLGVEKGANAEEIKKGFRKLAHQYHPDKPNGNEAKFKEINEAYQVLGDEKKRTQYDQFGSGFSGAGGGFSGGAGPASGWDMGDIDLGDIFSSAFGFGGRSRKSSGPRRGEDIQTRLTISFQEAIAGIKKKVEINRTQICEHCSGNGAEPGTAINTCSTCSGTGTQVRQQRTPLGVFQTKVSCKDCRGEGKTYEKPCSTCSGSGITRGHKELEITIPAGIDDGETLRMHGEGEAGIKGGPAGDLYIHIGVQPSQQFAREGYDILSKSKISYATAVLGEKIPVETIDGWVDLKVPAGTSSGTMLRLRGKGIEKLRGRGRGDHLVEVVIDTPKNVSRKGKKLLQELAKEL